VIADLFYSVCLNGRSWVDTHIKTHFHLVTSETMEVHASIAINTGLKEMNVSFSGTEIISLIMNLTRCHITISYAISVQHRRSWCINRNSQGKGSYATSFPGNCCPMGEPFLGDSGPGGNLFHYRLSDLIFFYFPIDRVCMGT
jgi:hypothetical protein